MIAIAGYYKYLKGDFVGQDIAPLARMPFWGNSYIIKISIFATLSDWRIFRLSDFLEYELSLYNLFYCFCIASCGIFYMANAPG